jgi:hypothetical protein
MTTLDEIEEQGIRSIFDKDLSTDSNEVLCDGCHKWSPLAKWKYIEVECDLCGSHPGIECPLCNWYQDWISHNKLYTRHVI